ncbi:MAG: hypothetical protein ABWK00_06350 [Desulfurococcaceae archaeon]
MEDVMRNPRGDRATLDGADPIQLLELANVAREALATLSPRGPRYLRLCRRCLYDVCVLAGLERSENGPRLAPLGLEVLMSADTPLDDRVMTLFQLSHVIIKIGTKVILRLSLDFSRSVRALLCGTSEAVYFEPVPPEQVQLEDPG